MSDSTSAQVRGGSKHSCCAAKQHLPRENTVLDKLCCQPERTSAWSREQKLLDKLHLEGQRNIKTESFVNLTDLAQAVLAWYDLNQWPVAISDGCSLHTERYWQSIRAHGADHWDQLRRDWCLTASTMTRTFLQTSLA